MINYFIEKLDIIKAYRTRYCAEKEALFMNLKKEQDTLQKSPNVGTDIFKYNMICKNTREK
jgi:hypothetical protein